MLRPQMLEAVFVAGCVFVGMTSPIINWNQFMAVSQREGRFEYTFISEYKDNLDGSLTRVADDLQSIGWTIAGRF